MAAIGRLAAAAFALVWLTASGSARADPVLRWQPHMEEASKRFGVPAEWIRRVMRAESGGRTELGGRPIVSHAGAMGLMQLMPGTWTDMHARLGLGPDPHAPRDNILAGTFYLRLMYERFGYPGLFAAYNAGPARYAKVLAGRARLPAETRVYVGALTGRGNVAGAMRISAHGDAAPTLLVSAEALRGSGATNANKATILRDPLFLIGPTDHDAR